MQDTQDDRLVQFSELRSIFGLSYTKTHVWRLERAGKFPRAVKLNGRTSRKYWRASDVRAFIAARAAERDTPAAA